MNMDILNKAVGLAMAEYKKEFGKDKKLQDGDEFATVFNDGLLIIRLENKKLTCKFLCKKSYRIDYNLNLTE